MHKKNPISYLLLLFALLTWLVAGGVPLASAASTVAITSPTAGQAFSSGSFTASGTATAGKTITVKVDGNSVGTTLATGGNWSLNVSGITAGSHSLSAEVNDGPMAYFANFMSNSVSVVDTNTNIVAQTISTPNGAVGVAYTPDGSKVYVTGFSTSNNVTVIDTATNTVEATIAVGDNPIGIAINPAGTKAYVTNYVGNTVSVINLADNTVSGTITVGTSPFGMVFSPDGTRAYVSNSGSGDVTVINTANDSVITSISYGSQFSGIDINGDGSRVYAVETLSDRVVVINAANNTVVSDMATCGNARNVVHSKTANRLVVACFDFDEIAIYDTTADANTQIGSNLVLANDPFGIDLSRLDSNIAYVSEGGQGDGNKVYRVDITGPTLLGDFTVGDAPISMGRFVVPAAITSAAANFSIDQAASSSDSNTASGPTLPRVGMYLATPALLALLFTSSVVYYDYRRHRRALQADYVDSKPTYTLLNHVRRVIIPTISYRVHERFG